MKTSKKLTQEQIMSIPERLKTMSRSELAREFGISHQMMNHWIRQLIRRNIEVPPAGQRGVLKNIPIPKENIL